MVSMSARGVALVLTATTLWGASGLFMHELIGYGLPPIQLVYYSNALTFVLLWGGLLVFAPRYLQAPLRSLPALLGVGLCSGVLSFVLYTMAVDLVGVGMAILLNYTSPAWVTLLAWRFLGEQVGTRRLLALASAFLGCALLARVYDPRALGVSVPGILLGLASGITWALVQVLGKRVLENHHPLTLGAYSTLLGTFVLLPFQSAPLPVGVEARAWPWLLVLVIGPSLVGPLAFYAGLRLLQAGVVSLLAISEVLIGVLLGVLVVHESMDAPQAVGALLVGASVLSLRPAVPNDPLGPEALPARA